MVEPPAAGIVRGLILLQADQTHARIGDNADHVAEDVVDEGDVVVQEQHQLAAAVLDGPVVGSGEAVVGPTGQDLDRHVRRPPPQQLDCPVRRAVIDDDELGIGIGVDRPE